MSWRPAHGTEDCWQLGKVKWAFCSSCVGVREHCYSEQQGSLGRDCCCCCSGMGWAGWVARLAMVMVQCGGAAMGGGRG
mgnify:CR=1 FL=1